MCVYIYIYIYTYILPARQAVPPPLSAAEDSADVRVDLVLVLADI